MATWIRTPEGWVRKGLVIPDPITPPGGNSGYGKTPYGKGYGK